MGRRYQRANSPICSKEITPEIPRGMRGGRGQLWKNWVSARILDNAVSVKRCKINTQLILSACIKLDIDFYLVRRLMTSLNDLEWLFEVTLIPCIKVCEGIF